MQLPLALADVWAAADSVSGWATSTQQCAADLAAGVKPAHLLAGVVVAVFLSPLLLNLSAWLLWILLSIVLGLSRILYSIFTVLVRPSTSLTTQTQNPKPDNPTQPFHLRTQNSTW